LKVLQDLLRSLVERFTACFEELKRLGLVSERALAKYPESNVHSFLQYCLLTAGIALGFLSVPEYRIRLRRPIDRAAVDPRLVKGKAKRFQTVKVDVAFLQNGRLVGVGEVYTPDEIHGCLESGELETPWLTPRHKLPHLARYEGVEFIAAAVGLWGLPQWRDARRRSLEEWYACWVKLLDEVAREKAVGAVLIRGVDRVELIVLPV